MTLLIYTLRRLLITLPVLWLITLIGFGLTYLIPADPLAMVLSERAAANPEIVRAYRERGLPVTIYRPGYIYGPRDRSLLPTLLESLGRQRLVYFGSGRQAVNSIYVGNLVRGDLGESIVTQQPVRADLARFFPATVELAVGATLVAILVGLPLGVISAVYQERWIDHLSRVISLLGVSVPVFWLGWRLRCFTIACNSCLARDD